MRKTFSPGNYRLQCLLLAALFVTIPVSAAAQAMLEWELVNPFRFINDPKTFDELKAAYNELEAEYKNPFALERALQKKHEAEVLAERMRADEECKNKPSEKEIQQCVRRYKIHYSGWFSKLAENNYAKTCWDVENVRYGKAGVCEDYVHPKSHRVRLWIANFTLPEGARIEWLMNGERFAHEPCEKFKNCIEFNALYDLKPRKVSVGIVGPGSGEDIKPVLVEVRDKLIVGLGDSYASGEGNPDIPAHFEDGRTDIDIFFKRLKDQDDTFLRREPKQDKDSDVKWLDRRCHRSMYSYQFKTALHLALSNPKEAITYISYACSGAEAKNIFGEKLKAKEPLRNKVPNEERRKLRPQLDVLKEVLCPSKKTACAKEERREIDYLFLSTGGNDIGFTEFVAYILTGIPKFIGKKPNEDTPGEIEGMLRERYKTLHDAFLADLNIKDCVAYKRCERILLTAYPNVTQDENGNLCEGNRREFDIPFGATPKRKKRIEDVRHKVFDILDRFQRNSTEVPNWTVVTAHSAEYETHGFCARGDTKKVAETFLMPTRKNKLWTPFEPWIYKAYEPRERWMRLPVDSKLTTDQVIELGKLRLRILYIDVRSNVMHPTAEGLSVTAGANFCKVRELEGKPCPRIF